MSTRGHVARVQFVCPHCKQCSRVLSGHYLANQKLVHAFTCAEMLPRQYMNFALFAGMGVVKQKYISSVYLNKLYQQVVADVAEESMKAAVERVKESPHHATSGEWVITDARHDSTSNAYHSMVPCLAGRQQHRVAQTREVACTKIVLPQVIARGLNITEVAHDYQATIKQCVQQLGMVNSYDTWHGKVNMSQKTVLVFGGSGTVGQGLIRVLLENACRVVAVFRSVESEEKAKRRLGNPPENALITVIGALDSEEDAAMLKANVCKAGEITDVVASIGGWWQKGPVLEQSLDEYNKVHKDGLQSHFMAAKTFLPLIADKEGTSYTFITVPNAGFITMFAGALVKLVSVVQAEYHTKPVRVNECVIQLLEHKADIHKTAQNGGTPLYFACRHGQLKCVELLLQRGAKVVADRDGVTPLELCAQQGYSECIEVIIRFHPGQVENLLQLVCSEKIAENKVEHVSLLCPRC
eukprot:Em0016g853a